MVELGGGMMTSHAGKTPTAHCLEEVSRTQKNNASFQKHYSRASGKELYLYTLQAFSAKL